MYWELWGRLCREAFKPGAGVYFQKRKNRGGQVGGLLKLSAREYIPADAADKGTFWKDR